MKTSQKAAGLEKAGEGVKGVMGGRAPDYETETIREQGAGKGRKA